MSKRTIFTYNIDKNKGNEIIDNIDAHLNENGFKSIISNNENVYLYYPTEIDFKVKGDLPECIVISLKDNTLTIDAWLYLDIYNKSIASLSKMDKFTLDSSKEVGLDGNMIKFHKTKLKKKVHAIENYINY